MTKENVSKICKSVINFFNEKVKIHDKASRFVKRKSKVTAKLFVETLVAGCLSDPHVSLERLAQMMKGRKVNITKQGLHERFNGEATLMMKNLLVESIKEFKVEQKAWRKFKIFPPTRLFISHSKSDTHTSHLSSPYNSSFTINTQR